MSAENKSKYKWNHGAINGANHNDENPVGKKLKIQEDNWPNEK